MLGVRHWVCLSLLVCLLLAFLADSNQARRPESLSRLTIWGALDPPAMDHILKEFHKNSEYPEARYTELNTIDLYDSFLHSDEQPDIILSSAMDLQVKLVNDGYAHRFAARSQGHQPEWASWRNELFGFSIEPAAILYNTRKINKNTLPQTHVELGKWIIGNMDEINGRIGTYDITKSALGYLFASQDSIHNDQYFALIESMGKANLNLYRSSAKMIADLKAGDISIVYNAVGSYALAYSQQHPEIQILQMQDYLPTIYRTAFINKNSKRKAESEKFINFLLSTRGQAAIARAKMIPLSHYETYASTYFQGTSIYQVPLDVGLLTFQDKLKKGNFFKRWKVAASKNQQ